MAEIVSVHILKSITGLTATERKNVFKWLASLPEKEVIDIFHHGVKASYSMKNSRPDLPGKIVKYCSFIVSARQHGWNSFRGKGYRVVESKQASDFSNIRKAKVADLIQRGRRPILRKKVLAHWGEVKELRQDDCSFSAISSYLGKTRKLKVSASYLARMWKEVECD